MHTLYLMDCLFISSLMEIFIYVFFCGWIEYCNSSLFLKVREITKNIYKNDYHWKENVSISSLSTVSLNSCWKNIQFRNHLYEKQILTQNLVRGIPLCQFSLNDSETVKKLEMWNFAVLNTFSSETYIFAKSSVLNSLKILRSIS